MDDRMMEALFMADDSRRRYEEARRTMKPPKYERGDVVRFEFGDEVLEGMVEIVDRYGTFGQNEEPSYDLYRFENNTLYKHVRESLTKGFVRKGDPEEISIHSVKFLEEERRRRKAEEGTKAPQGGIGGES